MLRLCFVAAAAVLWEAGEDAGVPAAASSVAPGIVSSTGLKMPFAKEVDVVLTVAIRIWVNAGANV